MSKQNKDIMDNLKTAFENVVESAQFSGGTFVDAFEDAMCNYFNNQRYALCVNSGTSALFLALSVLGIKKGDEVILPVNTFIATAWAPIYLGAKPVFVDCGYDYNIKTQDIEKYITDKTKAIIVVHLYGKPAEVSTIAEICNRKNLYLVEDCAQAFGSVGGNKIGMYGDISCFSFYPSKNLGAFGEGGAVLVKQKTWRDKIISLRNHGSKFKYKSDEIGYNMRMDGIQAAILSEKLSFIDSWNYKRQTIAYKYTQNIKNPKITLPYKDDIWSSLYHLYVVLADNRNLFIEYLIENGIGYGIHYPICCHMQTALKYLKYNQGDYPFAEFVAEHCISLPMYPELEDDEAEYVIDVINNYKS